MRLNVRSALRCATVSAAPFLLAGACRVQATVYPELAQAARAMGTLGRAGILAERGSIEAEGRTGRWSRTVDLARDRLVERDAFAPFSTSDGFDGHRRWEQDRSGAHHLLNARFSQADARTEAWLRRGDFLDLRGEQIMAVAKSRVGSEDATAFTVRPEGGNPLRLLFDDRTHLLIRSEREQPFSTIVETYSDYRRVRGAMVPFKIDVRENNDVETIKIRTAKVRAAAPAAAFAPPPPPDDTFANGRSSVPVDTTGGALIVPASVNGQRFGFVLDTGGHDILTPEVATRLGLRAAGTGSSGGAGPGRVSESDTEVRELRIGGARLINQHFYVIDLGFSSTPGKLPLGGILGLELFERLTLGVDEGDGLLEIAPKSDSAPCRGDEVPILFNNDEPVANGTIDGTVAPIGIDTGNSGPLVVFSKWAEAHNIAARFRSGQTGTTGGLGGRSHYRRTAHHDVTIGASMLPDLTARYSEDQAGAFSSSTDAGNIGRDLLRSYAVTFDYARSRMCLVPRLPPKQGR